MARFEQSAGNNPPRIAVLLPTYNGARYVEEQIRSILSQKNVRVHIFINDDGSTDGTVDLILSLFGEDVTFIDPKKCGGSAQNFFYLLRAAPWDDFDFVSLSDQDDIWLPNKLDRAVGEITRLTLAAYSSDVKAFWEGGKTAYIKKSQPQRRYDYMFEAGGPGCTHVYTKETAGKLRDFLNGLPREILAGLELHDWLFYAYCRENALRWKTDDEANMLYRQHTENVFGAAIGISAIISRLSMLGGGWYYNQVMKTALATGADNPASAFLKQRSATTLFRLWKEARELRRSKGHAYIVALVLGFWWVRNPDRSSPEKQ